jgi:hypothetical protein
MAAFPEIQFPGSDEVGSSSIPGGDSGKKVISTPPIQDRKTAHALGRDF